LRNISWVLAVDGIEISLTEDEASFIKVAVTSPIPYIRFFSVLPSLIEVASLTSKM
jgi:hypothetical protein